MRSQLMVLVIRFRNVKKYCIIVLQPNYSYNCYLVVLFSHQGCKILLSLAQYYHYQWYTVYCIDCTSQSHFLGNFHGYNILYLPDMQASLEFVVVLFGLQGFVRDQHYQGVSRRCCHFRKVSWDFRQLNHFRFQGRKHLHLKKKIQHSLRLYQQLNCTLCSKNFQNVKLRLDFVGI